MKKKATNYDIENLLYKAAGLDPFAHFLMNEIEEAQEFDLIGKVSTLTKVRDVYCYFKREGKLPDDIISKLKETC